MESKIIAGLFACAYVCVVHVLTCLALAITLILASPVKTRLEDVNDSFHLPTL